MPIPLPQQFLDGDWDFEDAVTIVEYVVEVDVLPDETIVDADGNCFGMDGRRVDEVPSDQ